MGGRTITVVDYDPQWATNYTTAARELTQALGDVAVRLHHIGSTAVPGLPAKPVIDMLLEVVSLSDLDRFDHVMVDLGYRPRGENGIAGRRYYTKGGAARTHHLHAFVVGNGHIQRHLAFRDYLRANPSVCAEYAAIKRAAALECDNDAAVYSQLKDDFIATHEALM
ncbi:GrpB family protein [Pectobacterium sp. CFBP8739]|uniref:GrpB family protein n=1 Tax=Pectobacterium sp. CFBP8739 TaxID=2748908 RepID=UPI0015DF9189|nr:GrpB family protein [Pectobacterium sp. CFBP8739]MBA0167331.1 GrpB family protein [Pectobacterium sp. CFBP8739]